MNLNNGIDSFFKNKNNMILEKQDSVYKYGMKNKYIKVKTYYWVEKQLILLKVQHDDLSFDCAPSDKQF